MGGMNRRLVCVFISQPDCPLPSLLPPYVLFPPSFLHCAAFSSPSARPTPPPAASSFFIPWGGGRRGDDTDVEFHKWTKG